VKRGLLALFVALSAHGSALALAPSSARDCSLCHLTWMPAFLEQERDGDLMPLPSEPLVNSEAMCLSCHDGSVVDSRERVFLHHGHRTGIVPPEDMHVPEILPLDAEGKVQCRTCHTAHGVEMEMGADMATAVFLRVPNPNSELCRLCHTALTEDLQSVNHPIDVDLDHPWPEALAATESHRGADHDVVCQSCHTPHGSQLNALLVLPLDDSRLCTACHVDQTEGTEAPIPANHRFDGPLQAGAHAETLRAQGAHLTAGERMTCRTCHTPHAGKGGSLLLTDNRDDGLCLLCHSEMEDLHLTGHRLALTAPDLEEVWNSGSCLGCHTPHAARGPMLWGREPVPNQSGEAALCLSCHGEHSALDISSVGAITHPTFVELTPNAEIDLPLFGEDLRVADDGLVECSTCHDVHHPRDAWVGEVPEERRAEQSLRASNTNDALCETCHREQWSAVAEGSHDFTAESTEVPESQHIVGPCSACHAPHEATAEPLWAMATGEGEIEAERLCRTCHGDPDWLARAPTEVHMHPVSALSDELQTWGDLPLFAHEGTQAVASGEAGIMTCLTCHDAHALAGASPDITRMAVGGDAPLCVVCHADQQALLATQHGFENQPASAEAGVGVSIAKDGACGVCHRVTDVPATGMRFRAAADSKGDDSVEDLCLSCHRPEGVAGERTVSLVSHPRSVAPPVERRPEHLPLFDASGARSAEGRITCTTCHDPHVTAEGGHFLRPAQGEDPALCMDCHHDKRWIAGTAHDLRISAPDERNALGETASQSTLCGACHLAHPVEENPLLWGHALGEGPDFVAQACNGCHAEGAVARPQPGKVETHPQSAAVLWSPAGVPSYDVHGHLGPTGLITCATCHNPHQWDGNVSLPGSGDLPEGDALTSFLRDGVPEQMCSFCHGREALVRYLLFHRGQEWAPPTLVEQEAMQ
jgi:predicted CXXCH cytochrome family protein